MVIVYDNTAKINFISAKDAKVSMVRLKWTPDDGDDYIICEKAFSSTSQINISAGENWQGHIIPIRTEITISVQSRNGNTVAAWSREGSFYLDPLSDYEILDGYIEIDEENEIIFSEFEEA